MSGMLPCRRAMVGALAHKCSPASSIWGSTSTLRTSRTEHSSSGCS